MATSDRVPRISDGTFKPVLEFGLGLSIGVGKTIEKGMLRAGATLTVEGIVEGVLAWFNPDDTHRGTALYFAIAGTVGIEGTHLRQHRLQDRQGPRSTSRRVRA